MIMRTSDTPNPAEARQRIDDWFGRGYVFFSDLVTHSTHLIPVDEAFGCRGRVEHRERG